MTMSGTGKTFCDFLTNLFAAIEPELQTAGQRHVFGAARKFGEELSGNELGAGRQLPVCSWVDTALAAPLPTGSLTGVAAGLKSLRPHLSWYERGDSTGTGSANFPEGHGNAVIIGPDGLVQHEAFWVGVSLLAPHVRYPDHTHPPEELYLVLSDGEFRNAETEWTRPGVGGLFHNPPGIVHAMRSKETPLLAVWMLVPTGG